MDIQHKLREYIIRESPVDEIPAEFSDDYDVIDSGMMDSMFMMGLITYVE